MYLNTDSALLNWRLRSKSSPRLYSTSIRLSSIGTLRNLSNAISNCPCPWNASPSIRLLSADSASDLTLPFSVTRKRLVSSSRCPTSNMLAGSISCSHMACTVISTKCAASRETNIVAVRMALTAAPKRGNSNVR